MKCSADSVLLLSNHQIQKKKLKPTSCGKQRNRDIVVAIMTNITKYRFTSLAFTFVLSEEESSVFSLLIIY